MPTIVSVQALQEAITAAQLRYPEAVTVVVYNRQDIEAVVREAYYDPASGYFLLTFDPVV